jgi:hypothetical protein
MATEYKVDLRSSSILDPEADEALALLSAIYSFPGPGPGANIAIEGVSHGIGEIEFALRYSGGQQNATTRPADQTGLFSTRFNNVPIAPGEVIALEATSASGAAEDRAIWRLDRQSPVLASGPTAHIPIVRQGFAAGVPDRLLRSRFFVPIVIDDFSFYGYKQIAVVKASGEIEIVDAEAIIDQIRGPVSKLIQKGRDGKITVNEFLDQRRQILSAALSEAGAANQWKPDDKKPDSPVVSKLRKHPALEAKTPVPMVVEGQRRTIAFGPYPKSRWGARWDDAVDHFRDRDQTSSPIGILFTDRLRFQPAGMVVGEKIYALSLAPGEEVQLRQVVETKRQTVAEDVKDREQEQQLTLSSTWTTEITDVLRENQSHQSSSSLGLNADADLTALTGGIPITLGSTMNFTGSDSNDKSTETSQRQSREATTTATSKMRSQHRVRLEVTNESSSSMATTRTVRNSNRQRCATFVFHKIYRKDRVSLERTNAQLCLQLMVQNPAASTRAAFRAGVNKIDPDVPSNYHLAIPESFPGSWKVQLDQGVTSNANSDEDVHSGVNYAHIDSFALKEKIKLGDNAVPPEYVLLDVPTIDIDWFYWGDEKKYGTADFESLGGNVEWTETPKTWVPDPTGAIKTTIPWRDDTGMTNIHAVFSAIWAPPGTDLAAYAQERAEARRELLAALDITQVQTLRDIAIREFPGTVLAEVARRHFVAGANVADLAGIFDLQALFIDVIPYWATKTGRQAYNNLYARLAKLPLLLTPSEILVAELTASLARVYLPVKPGMEDQAANLLRTIPKEAFTTVTAEVNSIRGADYPILERELDKPEDITGPQPPATTSIESAKWSYDWEKPQQSFKVLSQWNELIPTDGVHMEVVLSDTVVSDEALTDSISRNGS